MLTLYWPDLTTQGEGISLFTSESVYLDGYLSQAKVRNTKQQPPLARRPICFPLPAIVDPHAFLKSDRH